ncbi:hypothetical protein MKW98_017408 [Papaver atlanticum]|uniref:Uncharacterized protein n=1 Tax=Papaver atlanticum TaxID=357466 RepID=A0AAD4SQV0_9MAGN|nr:hypothetical protein MKW98_017408 [Papaver atlanticum]
MIARCDQGITGKQMTRTRSASHDKGRLICTIFLDVNLSLDTIISKEENAGVE